MKESLLIKKKILSVEENSIYFNLNSSAKHSVSRFQRFKRKVE